MRTRFGLASVVVISALAVLGSSPAYAHWCSNIFGAHARFVIKPEKTTVVVSGSTQMRVYLQNNFPYRLTNVRLRGVASSYTITTSPSSRTVYPGQNVSYVLTITGNGTLSTTSSTNKLNLQMAFRLSSSTWRGDTDMFVDPNPTQSDLISGSSYSSSLGDQTPSFNAATLRDLYPSATLGSTVPFFGRTGIQQLIHWFGNPFCYKYDSKWAYFDTQQCPTTQYPGVAWSSTAQFAQNCMRAGIGVGVRKSKLGSDMAAARAGAVNALSNSPSNSHKCLAAVVGGYLYQGASSSTFTSALTASSMPTTCKNAGLRALNGSNASSCSSGQYYERAACAAAEGLRNNDSPVNSVLKANAGDNSYSSLYYSYMLFLVQAHRRGSTGYVPFYPDAGGPLLSDGTAPPPPDQAVPPPDKAVPPPDKAVPPKDKAVPPPDKAVPPKDKAVPPKDTTIPPTDTKATGEDPGLGDTMVIHDGIYADVPTGYEAGSSKFEPTLEGGCGCTVGERRRPFAGLLLLGLAFLTLVIRIRKRR
jgi:MYXO-CTERM domain-containing protein